MPTEDKPQMGHNLSELKKKIQSSIQRVKSLKDDRAEVNATIAEVRAGMEAAGIPKRAFDMALTYLSWEPEKREGFDLAYAIVREAGGLPLAEDLFAASERIEKEAAEKKAATAKQTDADAIKAKDKAEAEKVFGKSKVLGKGAAGAAAAGASA
jgi:hypothetical protein